MVSNSKTDRNNVEDVALRGILSILQTQDTLLWTGTMTNLKSKLNRVLSRQQRTVLPSNPATLRLVINRVVNRLRSRGISVRFGRTPDHNRTRFVRFAR